MKEKTFNFKKIIYLWLPVLVWMGVIFAFSSLKTPTVTKVVWTEFLFKKTAHVIEYFILCLLYYRALLGSGVEKRKSIYLSFLLSVLYAATDEFHQSFTPGREPKLRDVLIDTSAGAMAVFFLTRYLPQAPEKVQKLAKRMMFL